jgi:hypothetical protein
LFLKGLITSPLILFFT